MRHLKSFWRGVRYEGLRHELGYRWWLIGFKLRKKHPLGMVVIEVKTRHKAGSNQ